MSSKDSPNLNADLKWLQQAQADAILDAATAAEILMQAAQENRSAWEIAQEHSAFESEEKLNSLNRIFETLGDGGAAECKEPDTQQTLVGGKSTRAGKPVGSALGATNESQGGSEGENPQQDAHTIAGSRSKSSARLKQSTPANEITNRSQNYSLPRADALNSLTAIESGYERYLLQEEVGRGGCGIVRKAVDLQLDRSVVLKEILGDFIGNEEVVRRFINEARITGQLEHPGIVPVHELGVGREGNPFFAMKEVRGETLADKILQLHALPNGTRKNLEKRFLLDRFLSVCNTLAFAHQADVIHRDIKPSNVMVGEFGETVLLDWGLARRLRRGECEEQEPLDLPEQDVTTPGSKSASDREPRPASGRSGSARIGNSTGSEARLGESGVEMTTQGTVLGTPAYMSPEQARGQNDRLTQASDVFSLGVVLYEILSGECPFRSPTLENTLARVARCDFKPIREFDAKIPRPLAAICMHAMQADPNQRYETAANLAKDLESYLAGGPVSVYREKPWEVLDRTANKHRGLFRSVFAFLLIIVFGAFMALGRISRAHRKEQQASRVATQAKHQAEDALLQEQIARGRAQAQLAASRRAADNWLIELSGNLQFYPGLETIRADLIEQGIDHYQAIHDVAEEDWHAIQTLAKTDPSVTEGDIHRVLVEWNDCKLRLGDLLRLSGHYEDARDVYNEVVLRNDELLTERTSDSEYIEHLIVQLANARIGLALIESDGTASSVASDTAVTKLRQSTEQLEKVLLTIEDTAEARNALARAHLTLSRLLREDAKSSVVELEIAAEHAEHLHQKSRSRRHEQLLANILNEKARLLFRESRYDEAESACRRLIRHYDSALARSPNRPDLRESRSLAYSLLGACLFSQANASEANEAYAVSSKDLDTSWELTYGETFYRENRAILAQNRSSALVMQGRYSDAEAALREAIAEHRWVLHSDGVNLERVESVLRCYHALVDLLLKKRVEPEEHLREIHELLDFSDIILSHLSEAQAQPGLLALKQKLLKAKVAVQAEPKASYETWETLRVEAQQLPESPERSLIEAEIALLEQDQSEDSISMRREQILQWLDRAAKSDEAPLLLRSNRLRLSALLLNRESGPTDWQTALQIATEWTADHDRAPEAWHWLAISQMRCDLIEQAENSLRRAVGHRGGIPTVEDNLVLAILAVLEESPKAKALRIAASDEYENAQFVDFHAVRLVDLLNDMSPGATVAEAVNETGE